MPMAGEPEIQLDAALPRAASSLRRLTSARALGLSCHAASRACLSVGAFGRLAGGLAGCAYAKLVNTAMQTNAAVRLTSVFFKGNGKVNNMFSEVNQTPVNLCAWSSNIC